MKAGKSIRIQPLPNILATNIVQALPGSAHFAVQERINLMEKQLVCNTT